MRGIRKRHAAKLKAQIALKMARQEKTLAQLSSEYEGNERMLMSKGYI